MDSDHSSPAPEDAHDRHTVAKWTAPLSLRGRLLLFVALIAGGVVGAVSYLEVRSFALTIDRELSDTAGRIAQAIDDDLRNRPRPLDPLDVRDTLHDFAETDAAVKSISVLEVDDAGQPEVFASTLSEERSETIALATRAITTNKLVMDTTESVTTVALPLHTGVPSAVVTAMSRAGVQQARVRGRTIALEFALPTILLVTLLVDLTARQLVHKPIAEIRATMDQASSGALDSRAPVRRRDELGSVAAGLNSMLDRLEHFNDALHDKVDEATELLRQRNAELADSYNEMLTLRETLSRTERMAALGQMAATVAHEVGTPLNLVSGYVQMLRDDPDAGANARHRLAIVDAQIQQVTRVLRNLLDEARQAPRRDIVHVARIVDRVRELVGPRLEKRHVTARIDVADDLPPVAADTAQIEVALLHLITNALDAMPEGGTLTIRAVAASGARVHIEVADTGTGIPPSLLDTIFEPWVTSKPAGQGTGLGLGIVRDVVRAHGGNISARNSTEGGAVFTIDLPASGPARSSLT